MYEREIDFLMKVGCSKEDYERKIELLMKAGCSKKDAEDHLKRGTFIYDDFEERFDQYMKDWDVEEEYIPMYKRMIEENIPIGDWDIVKDNGKTYYIQYVN